MPTYEFRCPKGHEFTHFYKTMSTALTQLPCPECGVVAERQLSAAGLVFKGSGFYLTDYGKNAHRGGEKATMATAEASANASGGDKAGDKAGDKKSDSPAPSSKNDSPKAEAPKAESPKPKAESPKPKVESRKPASE